MGHYELGLTICCGGIRKDENQKFKTGATGAVIPVERMAKMFTEFSTDDQHADDVFGINLQSSSVSHVDFEIVFDPYRETGVPIAVFTGCIDLENAIVLRDFLTAAIEGRRAHKLDG